MQPIPRWTRTHCRSKMEAKERLAMKIYRTLLIAFAFTARAGAQPKWFAPDADSKQSLEDSLAAAQKANHRLLVLYDGSWCTLCDEMHSAAMADPDVPRMLHSGYEMAHITVDDFEGLTKFATETLHAKVDKSNGLLITVLEKDGSLLATIAAS